MYILQYQFVDVQIMYVFYYLQISVRVIGKYQIES